MHRMTVEDAVRGIAGAFVLISLGLGYWIHPGWFAFTAFVGMNLLQSAFTGTCPMLWLLRRLKPRGSGEPAATHPGS
jgi:hypothetical protein